MVDTGFVVPEKSRDRFVAYYAGADLMDPMKPGLTRTDDAPYPGAYLRPVPRLNGGGGLVSTLPDMVALVRSLLPGGPTLLKPDTIALMMTNQLPRGVWMRFPKWENFSAGASDWRRIDPRAIAARPQKFNRRILLGRSRGHAMVDFAKGESCGLADDAASDGVCAPICSRVQAVGVSGGNRRELTSISQCRVTSFDVRSLTAARESAHGPLRRWPQCGDLVAFGGRADVPSGCLRRRA